MNCSGGLYVVRSGLLFLMQVYSDAFLSMLVVVSVIAIIAQNVYCFSVFRSCVGVCTFFSGVQGLLLRFCFLNP